MILRSLLIVATPYLKMLVLRTYQTACALHLAQNANTSLRVLRDICSHVHVAIPSNYLLEEKTPQRVNMCRPRLEIIFQICRS